MKIQFISIGASFLFLGVGMILMPKWAHFRWSIEARKNLIKEYDQNGEFEKARKLKNEIKIFEKRLPIYSKALVVFGFFLLLASIKA